MLPKYNPQFNPLGSVILYPDRRQGIALAINDLNLDFEGWYRQERHFAKWSEVDISLTRRGYLTSRFENRLGQLNGVEILRVDKCFLTLLDRKVAMYIKKSEGDLICPKPPKLIAKLDRVLIPAVEFIPTTMVMPGFAEFIKTEPELQNLSPEVELRLRDVKFITGLYEADMEYHITKFTIGIQQGKALMSPFEIDLSVPSFSVINSIPAPVEITTTTFTKTDSQDKTIDQDG